MCENFDDIWLPLRKNKRKKTSSLLTEKIHSCGFDFKMDLLKQRVIGNNMMLISVCSSESYFITD